MSQHEEYPGSANWFDDIAAAEAAWIVKAEQKQQVGDGDRRIVTVRAEAGTGSNYLVVATPLGSLGERETGGPVLITVINPWQDCWSLQDDPHRTLALSYVAEHLTDGRWRSRRMHGGDVAALTLTIAHILGRKAALDC